MDIITYPITGLHSWIPSEKCNCLHIYIMFITYIYLSWIRTIQFKFRNLLACQCFSIHFSFIQCTFCAISIFEGQRFPSDIEGGMGPDYPSTSGQVDSKDATLLHWVHWSRWSAYTFLMHFLKVTFMSLSCKKCLFSVEMDHNSQK